MSYVKTSWVARVGTALNRFLFTDNGDGSMDLTADPTGVSTSGTPFTTENMNKIETGIEDAHVGLENNGLIDNTWVDQGVKTTDNPTFAGLTWLGVEFQLQPYATDEIRSSFASPGSTPYGLTFDGTNLISCDHDSDKIYIHDGISATITASFDSPAGGPFGLTFDGTNLISCDYGTDLIYIHDGKTSTITDSFASPAGGPYGLTFDGTNLISCDYGTDLIYIHNGISENILSSFTSPAGLLAGLAFDGTNLISCDAGTGKIYIHKSLLQFIG